MKAKLIFNSYGKTAVRVTRVRRLADRHELSEMNVQITLLGDFEASYLAGDNSRVVATDSMKNTVYLLAKKHSLESPESFGICLAEHFIATYPQVDTAVVDIIQNQWQRISVDGQPHPTAFVSTGAETRFAGVSLRGDQLHVKGGLSDLLILKTTDSAFTGFVRDEFTTLPESTDRILATQVTARWEFIDRSADFNLAFDRVRTAMLETFAGHKSLAVQQTLFAMGAAALEAEPSIADIKLQMPNKHRIPFNFKPLGLEFENDVYVTTDEPSGEITGYLHRDNS